MGVKQVVVGLDCYAMMERNRRTKFRRDAIVLLYDIVPIITFLFFRTNSACGPGVTRITRRLRFMHFVATDTTAHCCDARVLRHHVELSDVTVTHHALHPGLQMLPMCPGNSGRDLIDAHPRNWLVGFCELGELYDRRPIFGYSHMTSHARGRGGKRHLIAGVGIGVAQAALQAA